MVLKIIKKLSNIDEILASIFLAIVLILTFMNVVLRYAFGFIINWGEEVAIISFIWCVYIGMSVCYRYDRHIAIDVVFNLFPKRVQKVIDICIDVLVLIVNVTIAYLGIVLSMNVGSKVSFILRIPYYFIDGSIVVGFVLMSFYGVNKIIAKFKKVDETENLM
ncbi:MAG: TRAP transporter small permease [Eubacteriales bacterium]